MPVVDLDAALAEAEDEERRKAAAGVDLDAALRDADAEETWKRKPDVAARFVDMTTAPSRSDMEELVGPDVKTSRDYRADLWGALVLADPRGKSEADRQFRLDVIKDRKRMLREEGAPVTGEIEPSPEPQPERWPQPLRFIQVMSRTMGGIGHTIAQSAWDILAGMGQAPPPFKISGPNAAPQEVIGPERAMRGALTVSGIGPLYEGFRQLGEMTGVVPRGAGELPGPAHEPSPLFLSPEEKETVSDVWAEFAGIAAPLVIPAAARLGKMAAREVAGIRYRSKMATPEVQAAVKEAIAKARIPATERAQTPWGEMTQRELAQRIRGSKGDYVTYRDWLVGQQGVESAPGGAVPPMQETQNALEARARVEAGGVAAGPQKQIAPPTGPVSPGGEGRAGLRGAAEARVEAGAGAAPVEAPPQEVVAPPPPPRPVTYEDVLHTAAATGTHEGIALSEGQRKMAAVVASKPFPVEPATTDPGRKDWVKWENREKAAVKALRGEVRKALRAKGLNDAQIDQAAAGIVLRLRQAPLSGEMGALVDAEAAEVTRPVEVPPAAPEAPRTAPEAPPAAPGAAQAPEALRPDSVAIPTDQLPNYAKGAIRSESMARRTNEGGSIDAPDPYAGTTWTEREVAIDSLKTANASVWTDKFVHRGSMTKGPIVVDTRGVVLDGNNRLREAINRGETSIRAYVQDTPGQAPEALPAPARAAEGTAVAQQAKPRTIEEMFGPESKQPFRTDEYLEDRAAEQLRLQGKIKRTQQAPAPTSPGAPSGPPKARPSTPKALPSAPAGEGEARPYKPWPVRMREEIPNADNFDTTQQYFEALLAARDATGRRLAQLQRTPPLPGAQTEATRMAEQAEVSFQRRKAHLLEGRLDSQEPQWRNLYERTAPPVAAQALPHAVETAPVQAPEPAPIEEAPAPAATKEVPWTFRAPAEGFRSFEDITAEAERAREAIIQADLRPEPHKQAHYEINEAERSALNDVVTNKALVYAAASPEAKTAAAALGKTNASREGSGADFTAARAKLKDATRRHLDDIEKEMPNRFRFTPNRQSADDAADQAIAAAAGVPVEQVWKTADAARLSEMKPVIVDANTTFWANDEKSLADVQALAKQAAKIPLKVPFGGTLPMKFGKRQGIRRAAPTPAKDNAGRMDAMEGALKNETTSYGNQTGMRNSIHVDGRNTWATDGTRLYVYEGQLAAEGHYQRMKGGSVDEKTKLPDYKALLPEPKPIATVGIEETLHRVRQANIMRGQYREGIVIVQNPDLSLGFAGFDEETGVAEVNVKVGRRVLGAVDGAKLQDQLEWHAKMGDKTVAVTLVAWTPGPSAIFTEGNTGKTKGLLGGISAEEGGKKLAAEALPAHFEGEWAKVKKMVTSPAAKGVPGGEVPTAERGAGNVSFQKPGTAEGGEMLAPHPAIPGPLPPGEMKVTPDELQKYLTSLTVQQQAKSNAQYTREKLATGAYDAEQGVKEDVRAAKKAAAPQKVERLEAIAAKTEPTKADIAYVKRITKRRVEDMEKLAVGGGPAPTPPAAAPPGGPPRQPPVAQGAEAEPPETPQERLAREQRAAVKQAVRLATNSIDPVKPGTVKQLAAAKADMPGALVGALGVEQVRYMNAIEEMHAPGSTGQKYLLEAPREADKIGLGYCRESIRRMKRIVKASKMTPGDVAKMRETEVSLPIEGTYDSGEPVGTISVDLDWLTGFHNSMGRPSSVAVLVKKGLHVSETSRRIHIDIEGLRKLDQEATARINLRFAEGLQGDIAGRQSAHVGKQEDHLYAKRVEREAGYWPRRRFGSPPPELATPSQYGVPEPSSPTFLEPADEGGEGGVIIERATTTYARFTTSAGLFVSQPEVQFTLRSLVAKGSPYMDKLISTVGPTRAEIHRQRVMRFADASGGIGRRAPDAIEKFLGVPVRGLYPAALGAKIEQFFVQTFGGATSLLGWVKHPSKMLLPSNFGHERWEIAKQVLEANPRLWFRVHGLVSGRMTPGGGESAVEMFFGTKKERLIMLPTSAGDKIPVYLAIFDAITEGENAGLSGQALVDFAEKHADELTWRSQNVVDPIGSTGLQQLARSGSAARFLTFFTSEHAMQLNSIFAAKTEYLRNVKKGMPKGKAVRILTRRVVPVVANALISAGWKIAKADLLYAGIAALVGAITGREIKRRRSTWTRLLTGMVRNLAGMWIIAGEMIYEVGASTVRAWQGGEAEVGGILSGAVGDTEKNLADVVDATTRLAKDISQGKTRYAGGPAKGKGKIEPEVVMALESVLGIIGPLTGIPSGEMTQWLRAYRSTTPAEQAKLKARERKEGSARPQPPAAPAPAGKGGLSDDERKRIRERLRHAAEHGG